MLPLYIERDTAVHRAPASVKLAGLVLGAVVISILSSAKSLGAALAVILALYALARLPLRATLAALKPVLFVAALLFVMQWAIAGVDAAIAVSLRVCALVLLASLVTFTTPLSEMIEAITAAARPLSLVGANPAKLGLVIALTLRFIPTLMNDYREIEAARAARGSKRPGLGAPAPMLIKTLRMSAALADAIAARGFEERDAR
ncbi:MAG: energy-coupling factor transporter transmembrane protein EcfT [Hyphomicrobiales bacterium]|nr:energy-coupling factor transporter transmembrane protein EcfT [Hyphomicrobiales bacterium]